MARFDMESSFSNIEIDPHNFSSLFDKYQTIKLKKIKFKYTDESLVNRLLKVYASSSGTDVPSLKVALKGYIDTLIQLFGLDSIDSINTNVVKIKKFIDTPGKISFSVSPIKPLSLYEVGSMENPENIVNLLNMKIHINS